MKTRRVLIGSVLACGVALGTGVLVWRHRSNDARASTPPGGYRRIRWGELVPQGWDPIQRYRDTYQNFPDDSDPFGQRTCRGLGYRTIRCHRLLGNPCEDRFQGICVHNRATQKIT